MTAPHPATAAALALVQERGFSLPSPHAAIHAGVLTEQEWRDIQDAHSKPRAARPTPGKYGDAVQHRTALTSQRRGRMGRWADDRR